MVGRQKEQDLLSRCLQSGRPEFLVVYGRRRVGKTFLVREFFHDRFAFYATGVFGLKMKDQLKAFHERLKKHGCSEPKPPLNWFEAFSRLQSILEDSNVLRDPVTGKKVVFLDELPWMDTARSDFKPAFDFFWNSWGSAQKDLLLIACGSATSWIIDHLLADVGGFYLRVTHQMHLAPFTLRECELLLAGNQISLPRAQLIESYMVFGGIPQYLNLLDSRMSLAQNIEQLCFSPTGELKHEFDQLYQSLFSNGSRHMAIIEVLSRRKEGTTRVELGNDPRIGNAEALTKALNELEQCGFIRKYKNFTKKKQGFFYQIIDPFTLFSLRFLKNQQCSSWMEYVGTPGYYSWLGNAFEIVCMNHISQMKKALGISGVVSNEYAWRSQKKADGAQIDLLIDRQDQLINVCEMKYSQEPFLVDAAYERQLLHKASLFRQETGTRKAVHITLVSAAGVQPNAHAFVAQNILTGDDLFL